MIILFLGEFSKKIKYILCLDLEKNKLNIWKINSKYYFENLYEKYTNIENWWKKRDENWKKELLENYNIVKSWSEYLWWFALNEFEDWYLIECLYSEIEWIWISRVIIENLMEFNSKLYAFSKNNSFYWFEKLDKKSETWASLFVYENKHWNLF